MQSSIDDVGEGDPNSILSVNGRNYHYHGSLYHAGALWCLETFCLKSLTCFILFSFSYIAANQNNGHLKLGCKLGATFSLNEKVAHLRYIYFTRAAYCIAPC